MLGRLEAYDDGVELDLGPRKQRAVLAVLLLSANHVVSTERLIDDLWGDSPPSTARATLQVYVAGLRKALGNGGASLLTRAPGYVLEVEPGILDLDRFTQLRAQARESPTLERRAALLHEALVLWRDEPLPELRTEPFSTAAVAQLEQLRLAALEERIDADLALGREADLVTELESLVAEHPYRERLRAQLMLALYRSGRQADALDAYQAGRRVLQDDLGLEPGNELRDLEAAILRQDEALSPPPPVAAAEPDQPPPSRRLSRRAVIVAGAGGLAAVALGGGVTAFRLRASGGAQVHPESVGVVDLVTREIVEIPVGFSTSLIAAGERRVWLVDDKRDTLTGIDPKTNDFVLHRKGISAEGIPTGLAAGLGSVWIAVNETSRFGQRSQRARDRTRSAATNWNGSSSKGDPSRTPSTSFPSSSRSATEAVWALEQGLRRVMRIDPATKNPELFAEGGERLGAATSIAVDRKAVWLGGAAVCRSATRATGHTSSSPSTCRRRACRRPPRSPSTATTSGSSATRAQACGSSIRRACRS